MTEEKTVNKKPVLSIIIPCYNSEPYIDELLKSLATQMNDEVEVIVVDDGSSFPFLPPYPGINVLRKENGGVSSARNMGLDNAKGKYIAFVDSDDRLAPDYIEKIFKAIESKPDTVYLSWKSMCGKFGRTIKTENDEFGPYNRCVWNRVFKKTYIKGMRFNEEMQVAEDDDFLKRLPVAKSHTFVSEPVYFYRVGREGGLSMRKAKGEFDNPEIITQVVLYYNWVQQIGGVETFFYNFCKKMSELYDIAILYDKCDSKQIHRLRKIVPCYHNGDCRIKCDTLIVNGIFDKIPEKVKAKKKVRLVHTCRIERYGILSVPKDCDETIFVSRASRKSFNEDGRVIPNIEGEIDGRKALLLVSATRLTSEKGYERMIQLSKKFQQNNIPFIWLVFTAVNDRVFPEGFIKLPPTLDISPYIAKADYLVQLSDVEAFCYSIQEALQLRVPVLTTPIEALEDVGVYDGKNGYILPFDINSLTNDEILKIYNEIPKCKKYVSDMEFIVESWKEVLGNTIPTHSYHYDESLVHIKCKVRFWDVMLNRKFKPGEVQVVDKERAKNLVEGLKAWEYI